MRLLLCLCLFCFWQVVYSQKTGKVFFFTGTVTNMPDGYVYLSYIDSSNHHYIEDSTRLFGGHFSFTGYISSPHQVVFKRKTNSNNVSDLQITDFFLEPGKSQGIFPSNDFKKAVITGSKTQDEYTIYKKQLALIDTKWKKAMDALMALINNIDVENNRKIVDAEIPLRNAEATQLSRQFIRQHSQSYVSAKLMVSEIYTLPLDSSKIYYSRLSPAVQRGVEGSIIGAFILKEETVSIGKLAPDFTQSDSSGHPISLHDFKGRYVLLDIWASWCVPCREEHPYLKEAYTKFKSKGFSILSLSVDGERFKPAWQEAIRKDSLTWPQLCDFKAWSNSIVTDYNVVGKGIPANFLINPQGIIVAMNLRGKALEEKLAALIPN